MPASVWEDDDGESHAFTTTFGLLNAETNTIGLKGKDDNSALAQVETKSSQVQTGSIVSQRGLLDSRVKYHVILSQPLEFPLNGGYCVVRSSGTTGENWGTYTPEYLVVKDAGDSYGTFNCHMLDTDKGDSGVYVTFEMLTTHPLQSSLLTYMTDRTIQRVGDEKGESVCEIR